MTINTIRSRILKLCKECKYYRNDGIKRANHRCFRLYEKYGVSIYKTKSDCSDVASIYMTLHFKIADEMAGGKQ